MTYSIAKQFSATPGGRFRKHGPYSGEEFRDDVLLDLLRNAIGSDDMLVITLDGTHGYGSSFLEEAFGGLIRLGLFDREQVEGHLELRALDPLYETYRLSANRYMENARPQ
ncbi:MAG: STAS-like domain-containing protein [Bryobacterales bacterium]|nr:STAS-like domain-containing protein [Bryobacterales bacterium]